MRALALTLGLTLALTRVLPGCGGPPAPPPFEILDVAQPRVAALEIEVVKLLDAERAAAPAPEEAGDDLPERVQGLVTFLAGSDGSFAEAALDEARLLGDALVPLVAPIAFEPTRPDAERLATVRLLGGAGTRQAAEQLLSVLERAPEGWLRANAAWQLGELGAAWVVPRLVLRLKYEKHHETVVFLCAALGRLGNYSGVETLAQLCVTGDSAEVRAKAAAQLAGLAEAAGYADGRALAQGWYLGEGRAADGERAPRGADYELELWRRIASFHSFQLRGVDDARFVLEHLSTLAAQALAEALHDSSPYVRVHAAQSLERMGPRAQPAGPDLIAALGRADLAPNAAAALGELGWPPGEAALLAHLGPATALELRVASARALGRMGLSTSGRGLREVLADPTAPIDLVQAAAESLVYVGAPREGVPRLVELLVDPRVDAVSSSAALRWWLARRAADASTDAALLLERWDALAPPPGTVEPEAARLTRHAAEAALLEPELLRLLPR